MDDIMNKRLKMIRKALHMTQKDFAKKIGITNSGISKLEKGQNQITDQMAKAICRAYNVNYDWLINGEGEMFSNIPESVIDELCAQYNLDGLDRTIISGYLKMDKESRNAVKQYMINIISNMGKTGSNV